MGKDSPDTDDGGTDQLSGAWIGKVRGVQLREPGPEDDGPILQIHGENGMAAMEFDDRAFVEGLTQTAAEIGMVFDEIEEVSEP